MENENNDITLGSMELMATAALFAMENEKAVDENFDAFFKMMVAKFGDNVFLQKLCDMRPRAVVTEGMPVIVEDNEFCFVDKIWFSLKKSNSNYYEAYQLSVGVNLRKDTFNPLKKIFLRRVVYGNLPWIMEKINEEQFQGNLKKKLKEHVYDTYIDEIVGMFR